MNFGFSNFGLSVFSRKKLPPARSRVSCSGTLTSTFPKRATRRRGSGQGDEPQRLRGSKRLTKFLRVVLTWNSLQRLPFRGNGEVRSRKVLKVTRVNFRLGGTHDSVSLNEGTRGVSSDEGRFLKRVSTAFHRNEVDTNS